MKVAPRAVAEKPATLPTAPGDSIAPSSLSVRPTAMDPNAAALEESGEALALDASDIEDCAVPVPLTSDLLRERAHAQMATRMRPRWESTVMTTNDPIVVEKRKPYVAERRARFAKVVKGTVGACLALCAVAMVASLFGTEASASVAPAAQRGDHRAPAVAVVEVESLAMPDVRSKAHRTSVAPGPAAHHVKRRVKRR